MSAQNQNVRTERYEDVIENFYRSGNFYAGNHMEELMKLTGLAENTILGRLVSYRKADKEAGKYVPRPNNKFTDEQIAILSAAFEENQNPQKRERELIGAKTNLHVSQVEAWFARLRHKNKKRGNKGEALQNEGAHSPETGYISTMDQIMSYIDKLTKSRNSTQTIKLTSPEVFEGRNLLDYFKEIGGNSNVEVEFGTSEIGNNSPFPDQLNDMAPEMVQTTPAFKDFSIESILAVPFIPKPQNN